MFCVPLQAPPPSLLLHTDVSVRLENPPFRSDSFGDVVPGGKFSAYQRARDESCCSGFSCISAPVVGSEYHPDE